MGRELRRVPLDFNWPIGRVWGGYRNPFPCTQCTACEGLGVNPETKQIYDSYYDFGGAWRYDYGVDPDGNPADRPPWRILGHTDRWCDRLTDDDIRALAEKQRLHDYNRAHSLPEDHVPAASDFNRWAERTPVAVDSVDVWIMVEARATHAGVLGDCPVCHGAGDVFPTSEMRANSEMWMPHDPPKGDGYQLWETTSEGSPKSPVFESLDALCEWCEPNATTFASFKASAAEWRRMLGDGVVFHKEGNVVFI